MWSRFVPHSGQKVARVALKVKFYKHSCHKGQPTSSPCGESKENIAPSPLSERQHSQFFLWGIPMLVWEGLLLLFLQNYEWMKDLSKLSFPPWTWCLNLVPKSLRESWWVSPSITTLPPVTLSAWRENMHRASYHRVECRIKTAIGIPRNLRPSENKFLDYASNLKLLWFSKFSKSNFNFYFQNECKVKDELKARPSTS